MSQILVELIKLANLIISISKALACAGRINAVFAEESSIVDPVGAVPVDTDGPAKIKFNHVFFSYQQAREDSLSDLDFSILKGQTVGIIGGTGSGKTSLVNLIARFYDVREGAVLVDGVDVRSYPLTGLREKIGMVPQKAVLFQGTLRANMQWGKKDATDEEIYQALAVAQAKEFVDGKEQGLELYIGQNGKNLSGGQRQRLTIARALVRQPEILIMDDSASALDFATDARLRQAIRENTADMTVLIVSQRASSLKAADQIIVMDDGKIAGCGTHEELMASCEVYREICLSQLSKEEVG